MVGVEYSAGEEKTTLLKRIIAIGGDVVSCKYGQLYVNGQKISESDQYSGKNLGYSGTDGPGRIGIPAWG
mgnify:CR=1 FL=1